jgi:hypothetical protein
MLSKLVSKQVDDEMKRFKSVYATKFKRLDDSVSSSLEVNQQMLERLERLEAVIGGQERSSSEAEERMRAAMALHNAKVMGDICDLQ